MVSTPFKATWRSNLTTYEKQQAHIERLHNGPQPKQVLNTINEQKPSITESQR